MTKTSVRMFVALAVMLTFVAVCHSSAWAPAKGVTPWVADSNDPNDPQPGPEMAAAVWLDDDPNDPQPGPEMTAAVWLDDDPNDPQPGPEMAAAVWLDDDPNDPQPGPERT